MGNVSQLERRIAELHADLREREPTQLAAQTGSSYDLNGTNGGTFYLSVWGQDVALSYPGFKAWGAQTGRPLDTFTEALLAYYFHTSDGAPQARSWIAFSALPDGQFYAQAFQGYTGHELEKAFARELADDDVRTFAETAVSLGGQRESFGDAAYAFQVLPRVALLVACWLGDEDFPPSFRILFDAAISHHLPTDACAILGSTITRRLIEQKSRLAKQ